MMLALDGGERSAVERLDAVARRPALVKIAGERGDHQHGFEPLAEQDHGGLNECRRHGANLAFSPVLSPERFK